MVAPGVKDNIGEKSDFFFDNSVAAAFVTRPDGRIAERNRTMIELLSWETQDPSRICFQDLFADPAQYDTLHNRLTDGGHVRNFEALLIGADGNPVHVLGNFTGEQTPEGFFIYGTLIDITHIKKMEASLIQAQKMEAVGHFSSGIAHDFNNLLAIMLGHCEIAMAKLSIEPGHPLSRNIDEIKKAGNRASALTKRLLSFCRKEVTNHEVIDLNKVLAGLDRMLRRLIGEDIDLAILPAQRPSRVKADKGQMEQLIMNLTINARDAMPTGGTLTIETARTTIREGRMRLHFGVEPGRYVQLTVTDTGTGMDNETKEHLFKPFFTTKPADRGTGLGLSMVYSIVKELDGDLWVYSEIGIGTTFKIFIPVVETEEDDGSVEELMAEVPRGQETILLVEDEVGLRELIAELLQMMGYTVLEARHSGEAILICEKHAGPIELMVTDVVMPKMSGNELADHLAPIRPDMKVLYMSGYTDATIIRHGVNHSGKDFLQKPFSPQELAEKVKRLLHPA